MSEPAANDDLELLRQFTRDHAQAAFTTLVQRHVNLVYSAALRQVRSPQLAEEVTQSTFADLARNAAKLTNAPAAAPVLAAWLYQVARHTAVDVVRKESRRQLREQIAVEMNAMNATEASWTEIEPLLDEAVAALDETDRAAVLLRFFENQSLRAVGQQLGVSDDAAQKRVSRAVERLREFFAKRGVSVGAGGLVVVISANAVQAAPVGLAITISAAALAGTAATTSTLLAATTKTIAMTTLQKTLVTATVAVLAGAGIYQARQAAQLREQNNTLQQQLSPLAEQLQQLQASFANVTNRLAESLADDSRRKSNPEHAELLKLRGQLGVLHSQVSQLNIKQKAQTKLETLKAEAQRSVDAAVAEGKILVKSQEKHLTRRQYASLYADLHLTSEQADAMTDLINKKGHGPSAKKPDGSDATSKEMLDEIAATESAIKNLLGENGYAAYLEYSKKTAQRDLITDTGRGFATTLPTANQLTTDQTE